MSCSKLELERFFAELSPRLETARSLEQELDRQLARRFSVFRYLRTDEMGLSRMIADLLDPHGDHGQGPAFLRCFTERLGFAKGANLAQAKVWTERQTDNGRFDIVVEFNGECCLAIENKSNFADDQSGQVEGYLKWLKRNYPEHILVYLHPDASGPSEASIAPETIAEMKAMKPRRLVIMPCGSSETPDDQFDDLRLPFSLADWLADCRRECDVDRLRWYLREAETHCERSYGGNTVTTRDSAVADFVLKDKSNVATALAVHDAWPGIAEEIKRQFLELIYERLTLPADFGKRQYVRAARAGAQNLNYIRIQRPNWSPSGVDDVENCTSVRMEEQWRRGGPNWAIGVRSPLDAEVSADEQERRRKLHKELEHFGKGNQRWAYLEWAEGKHTNWDRLVPEMYEELKVDGGDGGATIAAYFVRKFKEIASQTIPIIDRIYGS